jgi:hypothetical protein
MHVYPRLESLEVGRPRLWKFNSKYIGNIKTAHPRSWLRVANFPDWCIPNTCILIFNVVHIFSTIGFTQSEIQIIIPNAIVYWSAWYRLSVNHKNRWLCKQSVYKFYVNSLCLMNLIFKHVKQFRTTCQHIVNRQFEIKICKQRLSIYNFVQISEICT